MSNFFLADAIEAPSRKSIGADFFRYSVNDRPLPATAPAVITSCGCGSLWS